MLKSMLKSMLKKISQRVIHANTAVRVSSPRNENKFQTRGNRKPGTCYKQVPATDAVK